ncbi:MAG: beta-ketoacyl synthase [SAR324 cluster bacterium]|nr:beta-ketoacyl synthase [SAR324 cluster bacterium]
MKIYFASDNMITSLGFTTEENMVMFKKDVTGIQKHQATDRLGIDCWAATVNGNSLNQIFGDFAKLEDYTRLEKLGIASVRSAAEKTDVDLQNPKTLFILATTKGNIDLLENKTLPFGPERMLLWRAAQVIAGFFKNPNQPLVVSNACISGVVALITASRLLKRSEYRSMVVVGVDIASRFIISGFQSLKATSPGPCNPYDENRAGMSVGEGCGTLILTSEKCLATETGIVIRGGAIANDANHISGPSRTGEGLFLAIQKTLESAQESHDNIDYISAHGTGTRFNDNMESVALDRANLSTVPVNSLKGYFGHTLGAAGVLETAAALASMRNNTLIATKGFHTIGTAKKINVIRQSEAKTINHCLKIASGFGGCNAGILISKDGTF